MIENLISQIQAYLQPTVSKYITSTQLIAIGIILALTWLLRVIMGRWLGHLETLMPKAKWSRNLLVILRRAALPFSALILTQLTVTVLFFLDQPADLLYLFVKPIYFWLIYKVVVGILENSLAPNMARFISRRLLLPTAIFLAVLSVFGLLDNLFNMGIYIQSLGWSLTLGSILLAVAIIFLFVVLARWAGSLLSNMFLSEAGLEPGLANTISKISSWIIITLGVLIALVAMGIDITALTVILGGLSVGLAFGLQEVVNNLVSGVIILLERSVEQGDIIDVTGNIGVVQHVGVRSTIMKTRDNVDMIIPNSYFLTEIVTNLTHTEELVRVRIDVGVSYNSSPPQIREILLKVASEHPDVLPDPPPDVQFVEFGDSSLNFQLLVWTTQAISGPVLKSDLRFAIWEAFAAHNIEIPFPQQDLHLRSGWPPETR